MLDRTVWDTSWLLTDGSLFGRLLHTLIGYTERPTELQLIVYVGTLLAMYLLMRHRAPQAAASRAGRRRVITSAVFVHRGTPRDNDLSLRHTQNFRSPRRRQARER